MRAKTRTRRITQRSLFSWVTGNYRTLQLVLLAAILVSLFFKVFPLEMQRRIINQAISLRDLDLLYIYCGLYLGAVIVAGLLKYFINTFQAIIGQKLIKDMRRELYDHILHLPLTYFHRTQGGIIISAMTGEMSAIGAFLGGAIAVPLTALLTFAVLAGYMISLNPLLGLISMLVYPFELVLVPILQRSHNRINRSRVDAIRDMSNLVNEATSGIHEVQGNSGFALERSKLNGVIDRLYQIMNQLAVLKFGIKFSNNLFQSIGPFLLFLIGGYMAINGQFTIGALVAFLSAYEKVYDPWKEMIDYYQGYQDARVRYHQIMRAFDLEPEYLLSHDQTPPRKLAGAIEARNLNYHAGGSVQLLDDISLQLGAGKHLALVGFSGSGKSTLSLLLGHLYRRSGGSLTIDGEDIDLLSRQDIATNISFVPQQPFIFTGTVRDNLLYSSHALHLAGLLDGVPSDRELIAMIQEVGLADDVIRWGLTATIPPGDAFALVDKFLQMRTLTAQQLKSHPGRLVELYDANRYLDYSPLAINIIFSSYDGTPAIEPLLTNRPFREYLERSRLQQELVSLGHSIATTTIDLLGDFREDDYFFSGSPMRPEQFDLFAAIIGGSRGKDPAALNTRDQERLLALALRFTPGVHKIHTISDGFKERILSHRRRFLEEVIGIDLDQCQNGVLQRTIYDMSQVDRPGRVLFTPFCASQYLYAHSLLDNIIFGNIIEREELRSILGPMLEEQFDRHGLLDEVFSIGLDFFVGAKGDNLSGGQKQKIALARAFLKDSPILILDEATASLDNNSQNVIQRYIEEKLKDRTTVIAVVHRLDMISGYDHILVMRAGKIIESGSYTELMDQQGALYGLING